MWLSSSMLRALDIIIHGEILSACGFSLIDVPSNGVQRAGRDIAHCSWGSTWYPLPPPRQPRARSSLQSPHAGLVLYSDPASTFSPFGLAVPIGITPTSVPPPATLPQAAATLLYSPASHRRTSHSRPGLSLASRTTSRAINPASTSFDAFQIYTLYDPTSRDLRSRRPSCLSCLLPPTHTGNKSSSAWHLVTTLADPWLISRAPPKLPYPARLYLVATALSVGLAVNRPLGYLAVPAIWKLLSGLIAESCQLRRPRLRSHHLQP